MPRRVVTGRNSAGKSVLISDGDPPIARNYRHTRGFADSVVWRLGAPPVCRAEACAEPPASFIPGPGESVALTVTFPPDAVFVEPGFDPGAAAGENLAMLPGLADCFEADAPGMHTTPTVDYAVVLDGKLTLELDDGVTVALGPGDIIVQNAARHGWRNPGDRPVTIFVVLIGEGRADA